MVIPKKRVELSKLHTLQRLFRKTSLNTVCEESRCPNISECFSKGTATFMILGDRCTRGCTFCNVKRRPLSPPDPQEPFRLLEAVKTLRLKYVVVTSVTRDDLPDGGADHFARTVRVLKGSLPRIKVEVLIPDFRGKVESLEKVLKSEPDVLAHNVETVKRLYPKVRIGSNYDRSLEILRITKEIKRGVITKSALILGFGETWDEILRTLEDLRRVDCDVVTIGQYFAPSLKHHPVVKYYSEEEFEHIKEVAYDMGFKFVASGPFVRSSYKAETAFDIIAGYD